MNLIRPMAFLLLIVFFFGPQITLANQTCDLPCFIKSSEWEVQVKELSPTSSKNSSLWFRLENNTKPKKNVTVRAFLSNPFLTYQIPLFNAVEISELSPNTDFVFQHYERHPSSKQIEIELTWKSYDKLLTETFLINMGKDPSDLPH
ncbi:hypothetical protein ACOI1C_09970 [Bacillus sp. DJP31]|uniref:hypothetical protein n=1 Tax=Bacillus sp. DJP31 TaxID=3409789 RepID=UPI003BB49578